MWGWTVGNKQAGTLTSRKRFMLMDVKTLFYIAYNLKIA
jgi:hypothetical protein